MAAEERGVSPFPKPPSLFYKLYTDENVRSGLAPRPPAPVRGKYTAFGAPFNVRLNRAVTAPVHVTNNAPINGDH